MLRDRLQTRATAFDSRSWRDRFRDPSLNVLLVLEIAIAFLTAPLAAKGLPSAGVLVDVLTWAVVVINVVLSNRRGAIVSILLVVLVTRRKPGEAE
jgi:hypothetical protein